MNARLKGIAAVAFSAALALAGCSAAPAASQDQDHAGAHAAALPGGHVHGVAVAADGSKVLLGTHQGIFDVATAPPVRLGEVHDFMGFVGDPSGTLWASGHPGPGSSKPNPLGLLRSEDGGRTWTTASNEGVSDFHALTVTKSGLVGFDGVLKRSATGSSWTDVAAAIHPAALAGHPASDAVLATTEQGLQRSADGGATWHAVAGAPLLQFAAFGDADHAAGITPDGAVHVSADAGLTWAPVGRVGGSVEAITAAALPGKPLHIWAATSAGLQESRDGGATFGTYSAGAVS